jgi:large subunit ribosomal protein L22
MVKAELKNYRQSPRKVRMVVDVIRGKKAKEALNILTLTTKRSSLPIKKLLLSAIANAKHNFNLEVENLFVKEISVNEGVTGHRWMPRARGSAAPIRKRSCRILIILDELKNKKSKKKTAEKVEKTTESTETAPKKVAKKTTKKVTKTKK